MIVKPGSWRNKDLPKATKLGIPHEIFGRKTSTIAIGTLITFAALIFVLNIDIRKEISQWADDKGFGYIQEEERLRHALAKAPTNYFSSTKVPKLVLDVKFKHMQKISQKRADALEKKFLVQAEDDFVPATIRIEGIKKKVKAKIRLKGDHVDHLKGSKWSFRVHTKGKNHFSGLRRFSVQHPKTRGFQQEPLFFGILKQLELLAPRYSFVDLTVNGKNIGVMAMEEHFSKEILESNGRKEGVIVRFDESLVFDARDGHERRMGLDGGAFDSYRNTSIDAFGSSKVRKSERLTRDYQFSVGMLRGFVQGKMKASDVFDAEQIGKLAAAADLWGSWHVLVWRNIRFYLNPITMKLEPIAYDANHDDRGKVGTLVSQKSQLFSEMLKDPIIFNHYKQAIIDLSNQVVRGNFLETIRAQEMVFLRQLQSEFYLLSGMGFDFLKKQAEFILTYDFSQYEPIGYHFTEVIKVDDIRDIDYPRILHAYKIKNAENKSTEELLEIASAVPHEILITDIRFKSKKSKQPDILIDEIAGQLPITLGPLVKGKTPDYYTLKLHEREKLEDYNLEVTSKIKGYNKNYVLNALPYFSPISKNPVLVSTIDEQLEKHHFLTLNEEKKIVSVKKGMFEIYDSVVIPQGYKFIVEKGTTLRFSDDAILLSYSPIEMIGTKNEPIILEPIKKSGEVPAWQGMVVMNTKSDSRLENVVFRKTKGILKTGWQLTGGATFYKSNVILNKVSFLENMGEDALNIIHSKFDITDINIEKSSSDAFDSDFSAGTFTGGLFKDIGLMGGGDGIDISGSNVAVNGTRFINVDDKALSVGEGSRMIAKSVTINGAGTGAASKDGSSLIINNSHIENVNTVGLMAYIKKPEYGGASITADEITFASGVIPSRAQKGNKIILDGKLTDTENIDVKEMYKTIMKPGMRK